MGLSESVQAANLGRKLIMGGAHNLQRCGRHITLLLLEPPWIKGGENIRRSLQAQWR